MSINLTAMKGLGWVWRDTIFKWLLTLSFDTLSTVITLLRKQSHWLCIEYHDYVDRHESGPIGKGLLGLVVNRCLKFKILICLRKNLPNPDRFFRSRLVGRVSTEVLFLLPAEYGIFWKTHGISRNSAEFRGIFTVKFSRNSAEFRGIPYVLHTEFRR